MKETTFESGTKPKFLLRDVVLLKGSQPRFPPMEFATHADISWDVIEASVSITLPDGTTREVGNKKALIRDDDFTQLGFVSKNYEVVQNTVLKGLINPLVSEGLLEIKNTGWIKGGRLVFVQAQMSEEFSIAGESHQGMLTLLNSHDGSTQLSAGVTDVRVICQNTFAMAYSEMSTRLQHKLGVNERALGITETLEYVNTQMKMFQDAAETLSSTKATTAQVERVFRAAYGKKQDETVRNWDELWALYRNGRGNEGTTLWDAFNAVTEFSSHKSRKEEGSRFAYSNFGSGATIARRAIDAALELAAV
jgi:phage/plasmid-like protein (TIGR03299 family)